MSGLTSTSKNRADYTIIFTLYQFGKYLAFTPIRTPVNSKKKLLYFAKVYPLFLMLIYLGATIFSFYKRFYLYDTFNISQMILDALQGVAEFLFIEHVVLWSILKKNHWKKLLKAITQLEQKINWTFYDTIKDSRPNCQQLRLGLYHLAYLGVHAYDNVANWVFVTYALAFVIFRFTTYYIMFSTLFITFLCTWIENRYLYLDSFLKRSAISRFALVHKDSVLERLIEFSQAYKHLYLVVEEANCVFGTYFFGISICTVLEILNAVNYGMPTVKLTVTKDVSAVNVVFLLLYIICNSQIVMACDSVGKSAKKIWQTCLILYEQAENRELRQEYLSLANDITGLSPEFSAAGFWVVNQSVLSTLFSSVMTYLIIIIQFNMTLN